MNVKLIIKTLIQGLKIQIVYNASHQKSGLGYGSECTAPLVKVLLGASLAKFLQQFKFILNVFDLRVTPDEVLTKPGLPVNQKQLLKRCQKYLASHQIK